MKVDGIEVIVNGEIGEQEIAAYIERGRERYGERLERIELSPDGENIEITYNYEAVPFERIRRITGYLVGTMDRWNDAKTAEEHDRVKHSVG